MINKKYSYVLEDRNGLPVVSMVGQEDYCLKSIGNMLNEDNLKDMPADLKECLLCGRVRVERVYCDYIHDHNVYKNRSDSAPLNFTISVKDLKESDFFVDKALSKKYHKEFSNAEKQYKACATVVKHIIDDEEEAQELCKE